MRRVDELLSLFPRTAYFIQYPSMHPFLLSVTSFRVLLFSRLKSSVLSSTFIPCRLLLNSCFSPFFASFSRGAKYRFVITISFRDETHFTQKKGEKNGCEKNRKVMNTELFWREGHGFIFLNPRHSQELFSWFPSRNQSNGEFLYFCCLFLTLIHEITLLFFSFFPFRSNDILKRTKKNKVERRKAGQSNKKEWRVSSMILLSERSSFSLFCTEGSNPWIFPLFFSDPPFVKWLSEYSVILPKSSVLSCSFLSNIFKEGAMSGKFFDQN